MIKSCLNCKFHGPPVSLTVPKKRPCGECIPYKATPKWELTDKPTDEKGNVL